MANARRVDLLRACEAAVSWSAAIAALLAVLAALQLIVPGVFHDAPGLGYGRLAVAHMLVVLTGVLGNSFFAFLLHLWPGRIESLTRQPVAWGIFWGWNCAVAVPTAVAALAGILPHSPWLEMYTQRSAIHGAIAGMFAFFVWQRSAETARLTGRSGAISSVTSTILIFAYLAISIAENNTELPSHEPLRMGARALEGLAAYRNYWIVALMGSLVIAIVCGLMARRSLRGSVSGVADVPLMSRRTRLTLAALGLLMTALWPFAIWMDARSKEPLPIPETASEQRGRDVYIREGCSNCHNAERKNIGPDLSREHGVRTTEWHYAHLFLPRLVTPTSPMPSYSHLFSVGPDTPTQEGRDLVAYVESFGRAKELSESVGAAELAHPARARRSNELPPPTKYVGTADPKETFTKHCVGCHGAKGAGDGVASSLLRPRPANLAAHRYSDDQIARALWNGVAGTSMPAWRDMSSERIASVVKYVQSFGAKNDTSFDATLAAAGQAVYAKNCSQCHGDTGAGDGFSAMQLPVPPANFQAQQPSLDYALSAIAGGVEGTPMAPWTARLNEQDMLSVAHYIRSLYKGGTR